MITADGVFWHDRDGFVRGIIHNRQTLHRSTPSDAVKHKIHRPQLVVLARTHQRLPIGHPALLAPPAPDLELSHPPQPPAPLVFHRLPPFAPPHAHRPHP